MRTLLTKWWILLLQGALLFVLAFYITSHPEATLAGLTFWISLLVMIAGITGLIGWLLEAPANRDTLDMLWSLASAIFGAVLLAKMDFAMQLLTNLLGIWMMLTGVWFIKNGWQNRQTGSPGLVMIITGTLSILAGILVIFDLTAGAVAVSTLLAIQLILAGITLIILALLKRKIIGKVKSVTAQLKDNMAS